MKINRKDVTIMIGKEDDTDAYNLASTIAQDYEHHNEACHGLGDYVVSVEKDGIAITPIVDFCRNYRGQIIPYNAYYGVYDTTDADEIDIWFDARQMAEDIIKKVKQLKED